MGVSEYVYVWRDFTVYVLRVLTKFLPCSTQNKCSPSQLTHDPSICDVTVRPANKSELRSFHLLDSYAAVRGEGKSSLHAQLCCCWIFYVGSSQCFFFFRCRVSSVHWSLFEEQRIDVKDVFLDTKTSVLICIQKALLNRWCPELMSLNSFWSCWNFEEL